MGTKIAMPLLPVCGAGGKVDGGSRKSTAKLRGAENACTASVHDLNISLWKSHSTQPKHAVPEDPWPAQRFRKEICRGRRGNLFLYYTSMVCIGARMYDRRRQAVN